MKKLKFFSLLLLLSWISSCQSTVTEFTQNSERPSLGFLRLHPLPGHAPYLVNRNSPGDVKDFDLYNDSLRQSLREMHFICVMGGKRYHFCADSAALCRVTSECAKKKFSFKEMKKVCVEFKQEVISLADQYDRLINSRLECMSWEAYPEFEP